MRKLLSLLIGFLCLGATASFARPAAFSAREGGIAARISRSVARQQGGPSAFERLISSIQRGGTTTSAHLTAAIRELEGASSEIRAKYKEMFTHDFAVQLFRVEEYYQTNYLIFLLGLTPDLSGYYDEKVILHNEPICGGGNPDVLRAWLSGPTTMEYRDVINPWCSYAAYIWLKNHPSVLEEDPSLESNIREGIEVFNSKVAQSGVSGWNVTMQKALHSKMESFLYAYHNPGKEAAPGKPGSPGQSTTSGGAGGGGQSETRRSVVGGIRPYSTSHQN